MDVIRDVLDNQIVDRNQNKMGKVDGIVLEIGDDGPPRLAFLEVGSATLARRLNRRLGDWLAARTRRWGTPFRIPWSQVRDVGIDVEVDLDADETPALALERRLRERVVGRIPGAG